LAIAFYGMVGYSSRAFSPVTSAYFVDYLSWRHVYLSQTLLAIVGLMLTYRFLSDDRPAVPSPEPFDFIGLALWIGTAIGIIVVIDRGQRWSYWTSNWFATSVILMFAFLISFLYWEWQAPNPLMNLRYLLKIRTYVLAQFSKSIFLCVLYSVLSLTAKYMLSLRGYPRTTSGWVLLPLGVGMLLSMFGTAFLASSQNERTRQWSEDTRQMRLILGMALSSITVWHLAQIDLYTSKFWTAGMLFLVGFALGLTVLPVLAYAQYGLDPKYAAYAASIGLTVLVLPITLVDAGTTIALTRFQDIYTDSLSLDLEHGRAVVQNVRAHLEMVLTEKGSDGPARADQVYTVLADWQAANAGFCAYQTVLRIVAMLPILGIIAAVCIEPVRARETIKLIWRALARLLHNAAARFHLRGTT
jgi:DHA2 family multidrug resistance protein